MLEKMLMKGWDPKEILKELDEKGFEEVWSKYSESIPRKGVVRIPEREGIENPLISALNKMRRVFLKLGFEEVINEIIIDESEVYKQYGPEAPIILDRIYYLAGLPRPDIGLDESTKKIIKEEVGEIDFSELKKILREYRERKIDADELLEVMKKRLQIDDAKVLKIMKVFEKFFKMKPEPSTLTLRSHMTGAWFLTIREMLKYRFPPLYLFSIDWVFRREQRVDESHLRYYHSASCVIVDEELNDEYAFEITKRIIRGIEEEFGKKFADVKIKKRDDTARYYAKDREWEVYVLFNGEWYEIGTFGFYNPISLARYDIPYPVYNFGIGLERLFQVLYGEPDIRRVLFPYRYVVLNDHLVRNSIKVIKEPKTEWGKKLYKILLEELHKYKDKVGPFRELVYEDEKVRVYFLEPDAGKKFLGPASFNRIYIKDLSIVSTLSEIEGIYVGSYIELILKRIISEIEEGKEGLFKVRWVNGPSDVNLLIHPNIIGRLKEVDIKGPVFLDIYVERKG